MPRIPDQMAERAALLLREAAMRPDRVVVDPPSLVERVRIPYTSSLAPAGLIQAETEDPWSKSGKYALGWVYFCIILLILTVLVRVFNVWVDKIRLALQKDRQQAEALTHPYNHEMAHLDTDKSTNRLFPRHPAPQDTAASEMTDSSTFTASSPLNNVIAAFRYVFYRPLPELRLKKDWRPIVFPSLAVVCVSLAALIFVVLYCFLPKPLYWQSIRFGSPPLAIRAGMLAVSMIPWLIALSMKANLITFITGISHERLNVLHRWGGWICLLLSLIHTVPFYVTPIWTDGAQKVFYAFFQKGIYVYGTGLAALVPLIFLCIHSLAFFRHWMYELFVITHVPVAILFLAMMFWHCNNFLTSWNYLFATVAIWVVSYIARLFYLNWTRPSQISWLIGDEASVVLMPENAVKVTIATKMKWKPGQYVYLRLPGISIFENHPFTIASLYSDDFASEYGPGYHDMTLVFRPFGGFTKKVLNSAIQKGPWHSYRAFIDGPYGGMQRPLAAFDHVVLFAGGSGITALTSHLLDLIKQMRDGRACTKSVRIVWALKRPEVMDWFKEELRICREFAPPDTVQCQFYITAAKRLSAGGPLVSAQTPSRPMSTFFHNKVNEAFQDIANKRSSHYSEVSRHSELIRDEAAGNSEREKELRREKEDAITALPQAHVIAQPGSRSIAQPQPIKSVYDKRRTRNLQQDVEDAQHTGALDPQAGEGFDFGFPSTPTEFQKNLMRFAFLPAAVKKKDGWSTEYGRPDIPYMLREFSKDFGRRTCVFVCGPPSMRIAVSKTVAALQKDVWTMHDRDEIHLHAENYAI